MAAPPASRLMREARAFQSAARRIDAKVRIQRGSTQSSPLLRGAHRALEQSLRLERGLDFDAPIDLTEEPPPGIDATLEITRDKALSLISPSTEEADHTIPIADLKLRRHPTEIRLMALALAVTNLDRSARRAGARIPSEVLTLDRIDGRLVWAIGGDKTAVWLDRELGRPVRLYVAEGVLDDDAWTLKMTYADDKPGRGWFPYRIAISKNDRPICVVHVLEVSLAPR